jgi:hypothetical protein
LKLAMNSRIFSPTKKVRLSAESNSWTRMNGVQWIKDREPATSSVRLNAGLQHLGRRNANAEKPFNKSD